MVTGKRLRPALAVAAHLDRELASTWASLTARFGVSAVKTARAHGLISQLLHGVYASAGKESELWVRARALTLWAAPHGRITGLAAARMWRITGSDPARITVQVPRPWNLRAPPWARILHIDASAGGFRLGGTPTVGPADAVVQVWREARADVAEATVIAALAEGRVPHSELVDAIARRKKLPRRAQLRELINLVPSHVTSYLEYVAWRDVFPPRLFPDLQWQLKVWPNGRKRVMDAFDPDAMIDLEFDGGGTHGGVAGFERDRERDAAIRSLGYEPLHFTYRDLTERPEWCRRVYLELRAARLKALGLS